MIIEQLNIVLTECGVIFAKETRKELNSCVFFNVKCVKSLQRKKMFVVEWGEHCALVRRMEFNVLYIDIDEYFNVLQSYEHVNMIVQLDSGRTNFFY